MFPAQMWCKLTVYHTQNVSNGNVFKKMIIYSKFRDIPMKKKPLSYQRDSENFKSGLKIDL